VDKCRHINDTADMANGYNVIFEKRRQQQKVRYEHICHYTLVTDMNEKHKNPSKSSICIHSSSMVDINVPSTADNCKR
jgi:hypothetical protein